MSGSTTTTYNSQKIFLISIFFRLNNFHPDQLLKKFPVIVLLKFFSFLTKSTPTKPKWDTGAIIQFSTKRLYFK